VEQLPLLPVLLEPTQLQEQQHVLLAKTDSFALQDEPQKDINVVQEPIIMETYDVKHVSLDFIVLMEKQQQKLLVFQE